MTRHLFLEIKLDHTQDIIYYTDKTFGRNTRLGIFFRCQFFWGGGGSNYSTHPLTCGQLSQLRLYHSQIKIIMISIKRYLLISLLPCLVYSIYPSTSGWRPLKSKPDFIIGPTAKSPLSVYRLQHQDQCTLYKAAMDQFTYPQVSIILKLWASGRFAELNSVKADCCRVLDLVFDHLCYVNDCTFVV